MVNAQTTWIANANTGASTGANTFAGMDAVTQAMTAASDGDVIYVVPSSNVYDAIQVTKGVSLLGGGFNPQNPGSPVSTIAAVDLRASNVRISGVRVMGTINSGIPGPISNIMIDETRVRSIFINATAMGNFMVQGCIVGDNAGFNEGQLSLSSAVTNVKILNSIIYVKSQLSTPTGIFGAAIENNLFVGASSSPTTQGAFNVVENCSIRNNIFFGVQPSGNLDDNVQEYNISFGGVDNSFSVIDGNTSSNNLEGVDPLFVNMANSSGFQFSYDVSLQPTSPGKGTGSDGKDRGVFGGLIPYDVHGSPLPTIQSISAPTMVGEGSDLTVRIQAIGN